MIKNLTVQSLVAIFCAMVCSSPLFSQTDFEHNLTKTKGNKIVLLGNQKAGDVGKWKDVIDSEGVYEHGFTLLNRASFLDGAMFSLKNSDIDAFERWIRQKYELSLSAAWIALDMENKLIVSGAIAPSHGEFDAMLEQKGIRTPLKIVRAFLRENPDHLDAKGDLLREVRRRALARLPADLSEDLDAKADLKIWGVLASETDNVFKGDWMGIDIDFFRPDQDQPEKYSKLTRAVFRKRINSVESAIREQPCDSGLWNIWAWMARSIPDYKWKTFINTIEPFVFSDLNSIISSPSPDVCVWLIEESRQKKDWDTVIKFARIARAFFREPSASKKDEWTPARSGFTFMEWGKRIEGFPVKSAYAPHLEALLRLGRLDEANDVYDEMIRIEGKTTKERGVPKTDNGRLAANVARAAGMEELAKIWEQGEPINKAPYAELINFDGFPVFYTFAGFEGNLQYQTNFSKIINKLSARLRVYHSTWSKNDTNDAINTTINWKKEDGERWALIGGDASVLEQGVGMPEAEKLQDIVNRYNIKDTSDYYRDYMSEYGTQPGLELGLAFEIINRKLDELSDNKQSAPGNSNLDDALWTEAGNYLKKILAYHAGILVNMPSVSSDDDVSLQNLPIKPLSKPLLTTIESLLKRKPSSSLLWNQWLFWREAEGVHRSLESLIEEIKPSPLSAPGTVPPVDVFDVYYKECKENERWSKVIELLRSVWDREFDRITSHQKKSDSDLSGNGQDKTVDFSALFARMYSDRLGDEVGIPLMEAYLRDNKPGEAREIFNAWLNRGGKFKDVTKIIELAREKGYESLARELGK